MYLTSKFAALISIETEKLMDGSLKSLIPKFLLDKKIYN